MVRGILRALLACAVAACFAAPSASAAVFVVNSTVDEPDENIGNGSCLADTSNSCTLRAAIQEANAVPSSVDTVTLPTGRYELTIPGATDNAAAMGDLDLLGSITIAGAGARTTIIDANGIDRVFHVPTTTSGNVIQGVTITGGNAATTGGGGVHNTGALAIADSAIIANTVGVNAQGGGILSNATSGGQLTLTRSLVAGHDSGGGVVTNAAPMTIENSTLSDNHSGVSGGGVSANAGPNPVRINYTTFADNTADSGNAIHGGSSTNLTVRNSIVAEPNPCSGGVVSGGYNVARNGGCPFTAAGDQIADPQLGLLGDNGGPTDTHLLAASSPARDAADPANCLPTDQRAVTRPSGARCDSGAVEFQPPPSRVGVPASLTLDPAEADRRPGEPNIITANARNDDGTAAEGRTIRYAIEGANDGAGTATTDQNGLARIEWKGVREGTDTLTAYVDTDGNATRDLAEPTATAQVKWTLPAPRQGRTMNIEPVSGIVRITPPRSRARQKGASSTGTATVRLTEAKQVPLGTRVDVRRGRVQMSTIADRRGNIQKGDFYGGVYQTVQSARSSRPYTELRMNERLTCQRSSRRGKLVPARARSRRLWGNARGRFRTRGRHSVATVRGTIWLQKDTCTKTTTVVRQGVVVVRDLAKRKNVRVKRGKRYTARARRR